MSLEKDSVVCSSNSLRTLPLASRGTLAPVTLAAFALAHGLTAPAAETAPASSDKTEEAPTELPEMTVQSQRQQQVASPKFTVPLVDLPQTVSVISRDVFDAQGAANLSDVLRNTPGITFAAGEGGNVASGDSFYMRGVDTSGNIFVDGVRDTGPYSRDTYNLEQVEIAKGPAGADTGRGGSSGYINLVTKTPSAQAATSGQIVYGGAENGDAQQRATIDVNRPLGDRTSVRVAAMWQDSGVPGREKVNNSSWGVSPSIAFRPGTNTRVSLGTSLDRIDNLPDTGLPVVALPGVALPGGSPIAIDQAKYHGLPGQDYDRVDRDSLTARLDHDFTGTLRLSSQLKWIDTDRDALTSYFQNSNTTAVTFAAATTPINPATGATPPSYVGYNPATGTVVLRRLHTESSNRIVSSLNNLATQFETGRVRHSASVGLELSRETQTTPTWQPVGGPATTLAHPDSTRTANAAQTPYRAANNPYTAGEIGTVALYAFDTLQLSSRFLLNASVRWEKFDIDYESLAAATASVPTPILVKLSAQDDRLSWRTGVVFKPAANGSLYVAFANTFTPPGAAFALSETASNQNNPNLKPQEARNLEAGVKWDFLDRRVSASVAVYRSENLNTVSTDALTGLVTQDISQTSKGLELGVSGKLTGDWLVFGGLGLIDTRYNSAGTTSSANDGADLRFTPRLSGNIWTTYAVARRLTLGGGVQYTDSVVRSTANGTAPTATSITDVPDSWVVNLMAAYAANEHVTLRLNLNNVTDEFSFRLNNNGGRYYAGTPRTLLLTADWKF